MTTAGSASEAFDAVGAGVLVRYLAHWVPVVACSARRATFACGWSQAATADAAASATAVPGVAVPGTAAAGVAVSDVAAAAVPGPGFAVSGVAGSSVTTSSSVVAHTAEAIVRVFADFADRLGSRQVTLAFVAPEPGAAAARIAAVQAELTTGAQLGVHAVAGSADTHLGAVLTAAQAAGAPVLAYLRTDGDLPVRAVAVGRPAEVLALAAPGTHARHAEALAAAGFPLISMIELVSGDQTQLLLFGTSSLRSLEAVKDALWRQLDGDISMRIRDPYDGHLVDVSPLSDGVPDRAEPDRAEPDRAEPDRADPDRAELGRAEPDRAGPDRGPLRRAILTYLADGPGTVTEIRLFALTGTVYRDSDATAVLTGLIADGAVVRTPEHGRLAGDVMVSARS